jgi:chromosome partitioning protein
MTGKIIAIGSLKGGTGKTTIAVNLGAEMCSNGSAPVTLVDADLQESAAVWLANSETRPIECHALPLDNVRKAKGWIARIRGLAAEHNHVIVDLPPHVGTAMYAVLAISDLLIMPITPSPLDFHAASKLLRMLQEARAARGGKPACLLVGSKVDVRTAVGKAVDLALKELGEPVGPSIGQRSAFVSSSISGDWVGRHARGSKAHDEVAALAKRVKRELRKDAAA